MDEPRPVKKALWNSVIPYKDHDQNITTIWWESKFARTGEPSDDILLVASLVAQELLRGSP